MDNQIKRKKMNINLLKRLLVLVSAMFLHFHLIAQTLIDRPQEASNNMFVYLERVSREITTNSLTGISSLPDWKSKREQRHSEFLEMMGIWKYYHETKRPPLNIKVVGEIQGKAYCIRRLSYESLPGLNVSANLYIPNNLKGKVPAILYTCGHNPLQKASHYQLHAKKFAELGFVCLITETIELGEIKGIHRGPQDYGFYNWYSRGYNPGGVELWNGIRGVDLLCQLSEVDSTRIGTTGISGGGAYSFYIAAADKRVKAVAPVCGGGTLESHVGQRTMAQACDCMMPTNTYLCDFQDIAALIAPRPMLVAEASQDWYYAFDAVQKMVDNVRPIYLLYNKGENLALLETPGPHAYHQISRTHIFSFFCKHLKGEDISPEKVGDIEESADEMLPAEELSVFNHGIPDNDRNTTIQDSFVEKAQISGLHTLNQLDDSREHVISQLMKKSFHAFPDKPIPFNEKHVFAAENVVQPWRLYRYIDEYTICTEQDWRLKVTLHRNFKDSINHPLLLVLKSPSEDNKQTLGRLSSLKGKYNVAVFETRGVGETGWNMSMDKFVRRASAWTGRTLASMRIYDTLRCLEFLRTCEGIDPDVISLVASDEMCVVAFYSALLDKRTDELLLWNPPPTQDAQEISPGGSFEILNCLQIADLPQLAGMIYPSKITFIGEMPQAYNWTKELYETMGHSEYISTLNEVGNFKLSSND